MADSKKAGKSKKLGKRRDKCARYFARENMTKTAKTRRILRNLLLGRVQPGWKLKEDRKHVFRGR